MEETIEPIVKLRPTTTGDINTAKTTLKLGKRSEARNAGNIDSSVSDLVVRPRAPRTRLPHSEISANSAVRSTSDLNNAKLLGKTSDHKIKRGPKAQNLSDQWDSLSRFGRSNIGRSLVVDPSVQSSEIHYINLVDKCDSDSKLNSSLFSPTNPRDPVAPTKFMTPQVPMVNLRGGVTHYSSTAFSIPELPRGKVLMFNILSTWGDPHYLGLMGIEIFDRNGHIVRLTNPENQIWACPADINILNEYNNDPRTVDNLVDGVNHTSDDLHAWLAPFTMGQDHLITIEFDEETTISMIRIWNYNKSRIHSYRGARYVEINFVEKSGIIPIFKGEIKRAIGSHSSSISEADACSECILFTRNDQILALIEKYDPISVQAQAEKEKEVEQQKFKSFSKRYLTHGEKNASAHASIDSGISGMKKVGTLNRKGVGSQSAVDALKEYKLAIEAVKLIKCSSSGSSPLRIDSPEKHQTEIQSSLLQNQIMGQMSLKHSQKSSSSSSSSQKKLPQRTSSLTIKQGSGSSQSLGGTLSQPLAQLSQKSQQDAGDNQNLTRRLTPASVDSWIPSDNADSRPSTAVGRGVPLTTKANSNSTVKLSHQQHPRSVRPCSAAATRDLQSVHGRCIDVCALSSWGDRSNLMGVTGMTGMDGNLQEFALPVPEIFTAYIDEDNSIKRLGEPLTSCHPDVTVNGLNRTTDPSQMWIGETPSNTILVFHFECSEAIELKGIRFWNYNAGRESSCSGLKHLKIYLDGQLRCDIIARKAPGEFLGALDYGQFLSVVGVVVRKLSSVSERSTGSGKSNASDSDNDIQFTASGGRINDVLTLENDREKLCTFAEVCDVNQQYETPVRILLTLITTPFFMSSLKPPRKFRLITSYFYTDYFKILSTSCRSTSTLLSMSVCLSLYFISLLTRYPSEFSSLLTCHPFETR